jgi:hypothetical protein
MCSLVRQSWQLLGDIPEQSSRSPFVDQLRSENLAGSADEQQPWLATTVPVRTQTKARRLAGSPPQRAFSSHPAHANWLNLIEMLVQHSGPRRQFYLATATARSSRQVHSKVQPSCRTVRVDQGGWFTRFTQNLVRRILRN